MTEPFKFPLGQFLCGCCPFVSFDDDHPDMIANPIPDHAEAFAQLLEQAAARVRNREAVPEVAGQLILPIRIAARRV